MDIRYTISDLLEQLVASLMFFECNNPLPDFSTTWNKQCEHILLINCGDVYARMFLSGGEIRSWWDQQLSFTFDRQLSSALSWFKLWWGLMKGFSMSDNCFVDLCTQVKVYIGDASLSVSTQGKRTFCLTTVGIGPATFGLLVQCSANWATRSSRFPAWRFPALSQSW